MKHDIIRHYIIKYYKLLTALFLMLTLSACGLKGPLYYPTDNAADDNQTSLSHQVHFFDKTV